MDHIIFASCVHQPVSVFALCYLLCPPSVHSLCLYLLLSLVMSICLSLFVLCVISSCLLTCLCFCYMLCDKTCCNTPPPPPFFLFYVLSLLLLFTAHVNLLLTKGIISFREDQFWKVFICFSCSFAGWQNAGREYRQKKDWHWPSS